MTSLTRDPIITVARSDKRRVIASLAVLFSLWSRAVCRCTDVCVPTAVRLYVCLSVCLSVWRPIPVAYPGGEGREKGQ